MNVISEKWVRAVQWRTDVVQMEWLMALCGKEWALFQLIEHEFIKAQSYNQLQERKKHACRFIMISLVWHLELNALKKLKINSESPWWHVYEYSHFFDILTNLPTLGAAAWLVAFFLSCTCLLSVFFILFSDVCIHHCNSCYTYHFLFSDPACV